MALERWNEKLKDSTQVKTIICKWNVSMEAAIDSSDIEFLQLLLPFIGKHKYLRIKLSFIAIALEKQDGDCVNLMLKSLHLDKDENSILARLPKDDKKAFQVLFNRYCCITDQEITKELLQDFNLQVSDTEAAEIAKEHRLAMLTHLSHNSSITVTEDTIWNCINSGNLYIAQFLETLKDLAVISWMEVFEEETYPRIETGERPNTPLYQTLSSAKRNQTEDDQYSSLLSLYSAYGGKLNGIDPEIIANITNSKTIEKSYTCLLNNLQGAPKRFRSSSAIPSQSAVKIVQSKQDDYWTEYLKGHIDNIISLPWMEPSNDNTILSFWNQSFESIAEDPDNAIFEGLAGVASRSNTKSRKAQPLEMPPSPVEYVVLH